MLIPSCRVGVELIALGVAKSAKRFQGLEAVLGVVADSLSSLDLGAKPLDRFVAFRFWANAANRIGFAPSVPLNGTPTARRRGRTGTARWRLEITSGVTNPNAVSAPIGMSASGQSGGHFGRSEHYRV
jgi:hypothetical protein